MIDRLLHVASSVLNRVKLAKLLLTSLSGFLLSALQNSIVVARHNIFVNCAVNRHEPLVVQCLAQKPRRFATVLAILDLMLLLLGVEVAHCRWQADALFIFSVELVYNSGIVSVVVLLIFDDRLKSRLLYVYALV